MRQFVRKAPKLPQDPIEWYHWVDSEVEGNSGRPQERWTLRFGSNGGRVWVIPSPVAGCYLWGYGYLDGDDVASGSCSSLEVAQRDAVDAAISHVKAIVATHRRVLASLQATVKIHKETP